MPIITCEKCGLKRNQEEGDTLPSCPFCLEGKKKFAPSQWNRTKIKAENRTEYQREYRKLNIGKLRKYNREWMKNYRAKCRKLGVVHY